MTTLTLTNTQASQQAITIAKALAKEYFHPQYGAAHLLKALLHNDIGLASQIAAMGKDIYYLREWADIRLESYYKASQINDAIPPDEQVQAVFEVADMVRLKLGEELVSPIALLIALCRPNIAFSPEQLKTLPITEEELLLPFVNQKQQHITGGNDGASASSTNSSTTQNGASSANYLSKFCIDKTALAKEGKLDPIVGRDKEVRQIAEILGRRTKPNVIAVGEPGVGKTALIDGFAQNIINGNVPKRLQNALLLELDVGCLIAGASYKGEVEDRLKKIIAAVKQHEKAILFVDEIHILLDPAAAIGAGVANLLKPELARGEITLIGATTNDEYRKFIEADEAFNRRFELLRIAEPDTETAILMMETLVPYYEEHHELKVDATAITAAVQLAKRYIKERRLPDAAIDLMDRTMAVVRMSNETSADTIELLEEKLKKIQEGREKETTKESLLRKQQYFYQTMQHQISHILWQQLNDDTAVEKITNEAKLHTHLTNTLLALKELTLATKENINAQDIAAVVAHKTGIPLGKIQSQEQEKLLAMETILQERVVGQNQALKALSDAILESRSGLTKANQPIGSFFLLGPTGTGKTELAKAIADFLFNDERALIRFDMSEFKEEHSAALLYGAPPGYIGYKEGGLLVNKIRQQPYSVVLFDEIEKAHPSVFDIFLQILDEGKLSDKLGKEGDFSNAIILFTSNIGSDWLVEQYKQKKIPKSNDMMHIMGKYFRPEFLGRLTEIVPFKPISEEVIVKIFDIQLQSLITALQKQGIEFSITNKAKQHLANAGFTPKFGARPLKAIIRNELRRPISKKIIAGELVKGNKITAKLNNKQALIWKIE